MYNYEFVDIEIDNKLKRGNLDAFNQLKDLVDLKSKEGWRLIQVLPVPNEKTGVYGLMKYTIILEKEDK